MTVVSRGDHQLRADRLAVVFLSAGGSDSVAVGSVWEENLSAAALGGIVDGRLDGGGIVSKSVTLCAEIHYIDSKGIRSITFL